MSVPTEVPIKTPSRKPKPGAKAEEQAAQAAEQAGVPDKEAMAAAAAAADAKAMDDLEGVSETTWLDKPVDDLSETRRWVVGKPPEEGGKNTEYSVYTQQPLGWMARSRFFSLVSAAMSKAIRATGGEVAGMGDIFGQGGGTIKERAQKLSQRDFQDAASFASMALELSAYVPDLLLECYCIFLQVPANERMWAKMVFEMPYDPEGNKWGLKDEDHRVIIGTFVDQNYDELRGFFTEDLPAIARRVVTNEKARADHKSESDQLKPLNTSGQPEEATS